MLYTFIGIYFEACKKVIKRNIAQYVRVDDLWKIMLWKQFVTISLPP